MGHISQSFSDYKTKYTISTRIKQDSTQFITDTRSIISSLKIRIKNEENELYPLIEKLP